MANRRFILFIDHQDVFSKLGASSYIILTLRLMSGNFKLSKLFLQASM